MGAKRRRALTRAARFGDGGAAASARKLGLGDAARRGRRTDGGDERRADAEIGRRRVDVGAEHGHAGGEMLGDFVDGVRGRRRRIGLARRGVEK